MASTWQSVQSMRQWILENGDKRTDPWLLVYSPMPVAFIFLLYLGVVWAGPKLMKRREPVDLKAVLIVYNFAMVCLSVYMFHEVFFILRKKNSQLTFLHVYHHGTMIFNWWAGVKYLAGGQSFFIGLLNTFVHIVMYSYYGLAALGPHTQKYLWWKRYLTSLQLLQFVLLTTHTGYNLFTECDFPDSMNAVVFAYCVSLIALFSNFYYQSYLNRKSKKT
ncbi:elongation of very long chain fatty acids protein 4 isoform X2 [Salmo trutta]|nr:elongation of very long chain fatty acids protein 4-like isoform X2 [Salmo trutta]